MRKRPGRSGGAPDMMARATAQAAEGASALFAHLDGDTREDAASVLERLARRIRAGTWSEDLADLVERGKMIEATLAPE